MDTEAVCPPCCERWIVEPLEQDKWMLVRYGDNKQQIFALKVLNKTTARNFIAPSTPSSQRPRPIPIIWFLSWRPLRSLRETQLETSFHLEISNNVWLDFVLRQNKKMTLCLVPSAS